DSLVREVGQKKIDPKFFYDDKGSRIFEEICLQPQYYPTRTEIEILKRSSLDIVSNLDCTSASVIEFGSGSSLKTRLLLRQFLKQGISVVYFPIDISQTALISSVKKISLEFKNLGVIAISSDYLGGLDKISNLIDASNSIPKKKVMFFLGSSIGNFEPDETESFLRSIRSTMRTETQDNLFISFDLEKDIEMLEAAYNDNAGKTSKFNLNLLRRINKDLGGKFRIRNFFHYAVYNRKNKRIEMFIVSKCDQEIYIKSLDETISLKKGERIHTENSYKYSISQIKRLAEKSGFLVKKNYMDRNRWFDLVWLVPT
ncbi:MAG TPA: L-histidine N(alpha)-methyltransferase, partial [Nitrososphaeraceae archaeon]|nr:L-histidine N(alpha)-methyltransferase [Nitrososphaeraceae archaeon]